MRPRSPRAFVAVPLLGVRRQSEAATALSHVAAFSRRQSKGGTVGSRTCALESAATEATKLRTKLSTSTAKREDVLVLRE